MMRSSVVLLRMCCWIGAAVDGLMIVPMLVPSIGGRMLGIDGFEPGVDYRYAMMVGASLMAGWTALLVWASRRPVERKGILLLTVFPVVLGLMASGGYAVASGFVRAGNMAPTWVVQASILVGFTYAYRSAPAADAP